LVGVCSQPKTIAIYKKFNFYETKTNNVDEETILEVISSIDFSNRFEALFMYSIQNQRSDLLVINYVLILTSLIVNFFFSALFFTFFRWFLKNYVLTNLTKLILIFCCKQINRLELYTALLNCTLQKGSVFELRIFEFLFLLSLTQSVFPLFYRGF